MPTDAKTAAVLDRLQRYLAGALADGSMALHVGNEDGRLNSQENERQISNALRLFTHSNDWFAGTGYGIDVAPPRFWYDFSVRGQDFFVPVNVKVSSFKSADNLSSKEGLFYALTGVDPGTVSINSWERFCGVMAECLGGNAAADYFFMVVNKAAPGDVFWTSLKSLEILRSSGSNPPYQCKWSENRNRVDRNFEQARTFLLTTLKESFVKGADPLLSFQRHLDRYIAS